jgi:hypothetical protein
MYLIPQSWSHWHILISVFPSVGLVIVLGFYIAALRTRNDVGFRTRNDVVRRACLVMFGLLALLSILIYVSGSGSMSALSGTPKFPMDAMNTHYVWGIAALVVLLITGALAWIELWRSWRARRASSDPFHLVLGFATVSLALAIVADELGLKINHRELQSTISIADISTSQAWSHAHLILNHIPTSGFVLRSLFSLRRSS